MERAHRATREAATHEEAKPENDKDTRALEQSYLARGQAKRIEELRAGVADVGGLSLRDFGGARVALGALVTVDDDGEESTLLLAPAGGGARLGGGAVLVVTPLSPLDRALRWKSRSPARRPRGPSCGSPEAGRQPSRAIRMASRADASSGKMFEGAASFMLPRRTATAVK